MPRIKNRKNPKYVVNMNIKAWDIAKAGTAMVLKVRNRNGLLGTAEIGQGSFGWKPANKQKFKRISWQKLDKKFG